MGNILAYIQNSVISHKNCTFVCPHDLHIFCNICRPNLGTFSANISMAKKLTPPSFLFLGCMYLCDVGKMLIDLLATRPRVVAVMMRPMTALLAPIKVCGDTGDRDLYRPIMYLQSGMFACLIYIHKIGQF